MFGVSSRCGGLLLVFIVLVYLVVGTLFAVYTPAWQAPDEPAHYNYVRYLAEQGRFPVLQNGDFPLKYLEEIKHRRFPPELSIDPIRYEFHQPPLYYLLAALAFKLFGGALVPLRLLSVALGAGLVYVAYRLTLAICPARPVLALGTAAFVAFVPMHVAMTAAVNNDTLSELLTALVLWNLMRYLLGETEEKKTLVVVGVLLGLGLLTKIHALVGVAVAVVTVLICRWRDWRQAARDLAWLLIPALALAVPWLVRNIAVYGWPDVMGLARHDEVVFGQPTTAEWIADYGWRYVLGEGLRTTYRSFWGQFGWMAVPMNGRIYLGLGLFTAVAVAGLLWWLATALIGARRGLTSSQEGSLDRQGSLPEARGEAKIVTHRQLSPAVLLPLLALLTFLSYLWYNTKFVQHQGRYLFPALVPLGLGLALGWWVVVHRVRALIGQPGRPERIEGLLFALPYAALAVLDVVCLFAFVIPYLS